ncbi:hypothetical protein TWF694_006771 [Orbilia ellipsospora]|uniref:Uncharacterized protein n=1 Tax=Orbilia ellipsospora TaxID=2528407 RepID=A0AAV9XL77_9PEZI
MSTEAVENTKSTIKVELYNYYKSNDKKPLSSLPAEDLETATKAITKVLKSVAAQNCMPNLIEGPEFATIDERGWTITLLPPPEVSSQILTKYSKAVDAFDLKNLQVDVKILDQYASAPAGSSYKEHRLLEIICTAIHTLAIDLYTTSFPIPEVVEVNSYLPPPYPVIAHSQYYASKPWKKVFDLKAVGFWAEAQIFGGVIYFDRAHDASKPDSAEGNAYQGVWVHGLPNTYLPCLWHVPDDVVSKAINEAAFPLDPSAAKDHNNLIGLQEAQEEHAIYRDPHLANHSTYIGEAHVDEDVGLSDADVDELKTLGWFKSQDE